MSENFSLVMRVNGDITPEVFRNALDKVRSRHLALVPGFYVGNADENLVIQCSFVEADGENYWIEIVKKEQFKEFISFPFVRFTVLKYVNRFEVIGTFFHRYCDGKSGVFVLRDILAILACPEAKLTPIDLPPSVFSLIPRSIFFNVSFWRRVIYSVVKLHLKIQMKKYRKSIADNHSVCLDQMTQQLVIVPVQLSVGQTSNLITRCKSEGVSVHAAVCVAWILALATVSGDHKTQWCVSSPVSLRERIDFSVKDTAGSYLSFVETKVDLAGDHKFWDIARQFMKNFRSGMTDSSLLSTLMIPGIVLSQISQDSVDILMSLLFTGPVKFDCSISNLGNLPIPKENGNLTVEAFYGPLVSPSSFQRTVGVNSLGGQMSMSFLCRQSMTEESEAEFLTHQAIDILFKNAGC